MTKFKGTQGELELIYVSEVCIGIGVNTKVLGGMMTQVTANSILPDTDEEYAEQKEEILANMQLYASAPKMLAFLEKIDQKKTFHQGDFTDLKALLKEVLTVNEP